MVWETKKMNSAGLWVVQFDEIFNAGFKLSEFFLLEMQTNKVSFSFKLNWYMFDVLAARYYLDPQIVSASGSLLPCDKSRGFLQRQKVIVIYYVKKFVKEYQ